jgi:hypothetical protein
MATIDDLSRIAQSLPQTTGSAAGGAFEVLGKGIAWTWKERLAPKTPRLERRDVWAIRTPDQATKEMLIEAAPDRFFTEPHYNGFPAVLARLALVEPEELAHLLTAAWRARAPRKLVAAFDADKA